MLGTWPFVGREDELELIARVMQRGGHQAIVLTGRAGVGKSRLAAEAVAAAQSRGWAMVRVIATAAAASIPFGALGHLLPPSEGCPAGAPSLSCSDGGAG